MSQLRGEVRVVDLSGPLTIASMAGCRMRLLDAFQGQRDIVIDCKDATDFDIAFVQVVIAARKLADEHGIGLRLATPTPAALQDIIQRGGFAVALGMGPEGTAAPQPARH